jgi:hypothetical protein
MIIKVDVPVIVAFISNPKTRSFGPVTIRWDGRDYHVTKLGLHHHYWSGRTLFHVFSVICNDTFFRLNFNTDSLTWRLEEVSDGLPS